MSSSALLVLAVPLAGCLFVDEINHPPIAVVDDTSTSNLFKGQRAVFDPSRSTDPDLGDTASLTFRWSVDGLDVNTMDNPKLFGFVGDPGPSVLVSFCETGPHSVSVIAFDRHHAQSAPSMVAVTVAPTPPSQLTIETGGHVTACNDHLVGVPLPLAGNAQLAHPGSIGSDPASLACAAETLTYHWHVTGPNSQPGAISIVEGECTSNNPPSFGMTDAPTQLGGDTTANTACLVATAPGMYTVELKVDADGAFFSSKTDSSKDMRPSVTANIAIGPDRPACADGFIPALGSYVLDRSSPQTFAVTAVLDDADYYPGTTGTRFTWSLWHESDATWRDIPDWSLPTYTVDPTLFAVDEQVRVRVRVQDRVDRTAPSCDPSADVCPLAHDFPDQLCFDPTTIDCEAWATWDVRFR